jgi:hypothetical protein
MADQSQDVFAPIEKGYSMGDELQIGVVRGSGKTKFVFDIEAIGLSRTILNDYSPSVEPLMEYYKHQTRVSDKDEAWSFVVDQMTNDIRKAFDKQVSRDLENMSTTCNTNSTDTTPITSEELLRLIEQFHPKEEKRQASLHPLWGVGVVKKPQMIVRTEGF